MAEHKSFIEQLEIDVSNALGVGVKRITDSLMLIGGISMNSKNTQRITEAIRQFKLTSVMIERELSEWESTESEHDLLIFFLTRLAAYKATLLGLEETIGEVFNVNLSKATEGLSQQRDVMKLLGRDEKS